MSALVCDASVLVKLLVQEDDSNIAVEIVNRNRIILPDFARLEVGSTLWSRVRTRQCALTDALRLLDQLDELGFDIRSTAALVRRALSIAAHIDHPIYDSLYLALAEDMDVPLVTADRRFISAVRRARFEAVDVQPLSDFA